MNCSVVLTPLLIEKMRRPSAVGLSRARLEQSLLNRDSPRLTLVAAPAGAGKSTLMAQVAEKAGIPVAWYRTTPEDGNVETFLSNLSTAVAGQPLAMRADSTTATSTDEWVASFYDLRRPTILFLDDLHEIAGTPAERAFGKLISVPPPMLRLILASRRMPEFNLASLRARNAINEINSDDLRFRVWEVEELFTLVYGEPLYPETAAALTRRTGGWAAGLQLFHLANARKTSSARQQAVSALGPRARLIRTYLTRNVLDGLPEDRKRFLVRTSALGLLTGALCDGLLETTGSATVLEELERDQLFTTSVDDGLTYRYHEVLQRHLQMMLIQELGAEETRAWYARCAKLLDASGAGAEALRAYAMAEDWSSLLRLVHRPSAETTTAIAVQTEWPLPSSLIKHDPWLALGDARRRLRHGAVEDAIAGFAHAATLLDDPEFQRTCEAESAAIRVWSRGAVELLHVPDTTTGWSSQLRAITRDGPTAHRRRMRRPEVPRYSLSREGLLNGVEALLSGEFASANAFFAHAAASTRDVGLPRLAAQLGEVVTDAADGRASDYAARLEEITLDADAHGYAWISRLARGFLTAILAVSDGAPWRLDAFSELLAECDRDGDPWGAALLQLACAIAGGVVGHAAAPAHFADAERRLVELDAGALASGAQALAVQYAGVAEDAPRSGSSRRQVRVFCLGGFRITVDDQTADLHDVRPRALSLLRMLAYAYETNVHRERLIDTLWPGVTLDVGTRRLQVAVSSVRRALQQCGAAEVEGIQRRADSYQLSLGDAIVDVVEFERLIAAARHEQHSERRIELRTQALDLYAGDLFPEEGSAEHIVHERDRLRFVAAETACNLARDYNSLGNLTGAAAAARQSLDLDPYQDAAWQLLADCLAAQGDETAAARTRIEHDRLRASLEDMTGNTDGLGVTVGNRAAR